MTWVGSLVLMVPLTSAADSVFKKNVLHENFLIREYFNSRTMILGVLENFLATFQPAGVGFTGQVVPEIHLAILCLDVGSFVISILRILLIVLLVDLAAAQLPLDVVFLTL